MLTIVLLIILVLVVWAALGLGYLNMNESRPKLVPTFWYPRAHQGDKIILFVSPLVSLTMMIVGLILEALIAFLAFVVWTGEFTCLDPGKKPLTFQQLLATGREALAQPIWRKINFT